MKKLITRTAAVAMSAGLLLTGTAAEITPVGQIGDFTFTVGEITRKISDNYEALVRA